MGCGFAQYSLLAVQPVPNEAAHPSTASVPITVLLYDGPLLCGFNVAIKGLIIVYSNAVGHKYKAFRTYVRYVLFSGFHPGLINKSSQVAF